jgi:hypothetical protein
MYLSGVYDHVIRATGWKYIDAALFPAGAPSVLRESTLPALSTIGESSIPNLFFIGAGASNGDRKSTYGFIVGFRYMVRTLFELLEQRYESVPYPRTQCPLESERDLDVLVDSLVTRMSTNSSLYAMWGALADVIVVGDRRATWFRDLPLPYVLQQPAFLGGNEVIAITLEFGYDKFPAETPSLNFVHLNDPGGEGLCAALIHPVIRHYRDGILINELHTHSGLFVRYDRKNEEFAPELSGNGMRNKLFNAINSIFQVASSDRRANIISEGPAEAPSFRPWTDEEKYEDPRLPRCDRTHEPDYVPDISKYI